MPKSTQASSTLFSLLYDCVHFLLFDNRYFWALAGLVVLGDAVLTQLVIKLVPCKSLLFVQSLLRPTHATDTEIDWETYMVHIDLYLNGERDYSKITGPTGPVV